MTPGRAFNLALACVSHRARCCQTCQSVSLTLSRACMAMRPFLFCCSTSGCHITVLRVCAGGARVLLVSSPCSWVRGRQGCSGCYVIRSLAGGRFNSMTWGLLVLTCRMPRVDARAGMGVVRRKPTTTTGEGAFAEMLATRAPSRQNAVAQAEARLASALSAAIQRADAATLQALGWFGRCCTHAVLQGHVTDGATLAGTVVCGGIALLLCFVCACWGNKQHQHHAGVNRCRNDSILDGDRAR